MKPLHKIALVGTTFVLAAATGHVMQTSAPDGPAPDPAPAAAAMQLAMTAPTEPTVTPPPSLPPLVMRAPAAEAAPGPLPQDPAQPGPGFAQAECPAPQLTGEAVSGGAVRLTVTAPCHASRQVEIRHEALRLPIRLSETGVWSGVVPAFAEQAVFRLSLNDTEAPPVLTLSVPDATAFNRLAVVVGADTGLDLRGPEDDGEPVRIARFSAPGAATAVQIYSAPAAMTGGRLVLDVPVTPQSCGKDMVGAIHRMSGKTSDQDVFRLAMPDCGDGEGAVMMPLPGFPLAVAAN